VLPASLGQIAAMQVITQYYNIQMLCLGLQKGRYGLCPSSTAEQYLLLWDPCLQHTGGIGSTPRTSGNLYMLGTYVNGAVADLCSMGNMAAN